MAGELVELERDIARTRAELAGTLQSLASRLPGRWGKRLFQRQERASAGAARLAHAGAKPRRGGARAGRRVTSRTVIGGAIALAVLVPRRLRRRSS